MMKERLHEIREKALAQINSTDSLEKLNEVRVSFPVSYTHLTLPTT